MPNLQATPYGYQSAGYANDLIQGLLGYMKDPQRTQQMQMLAGLLESTGVPKTVERAAYAQDTKGLIDALTNVNRANVPLLKPETAEAIMNVAPLVGPTARAAESGLLAAGRVGERYAEKVVPQIMERGGLPAQLLGDLAQGSRRQIFVPASQEEAFQAAKLLRKKTPEEVWKETGVAKFGDDFVKEISDKESSFNTDADIHESAEKIRQRNAELKQILNESKSTYPDLFPKELTAARRPLREEIKANQGLLEMPRGYVSDSSFSGNMAAIAYEHPELYKQVPEMKGVVIRQGRDLGDFLGAYENSPSRPLGSIDITKLGLKNDPRSTATHEMQHAVQEFYGLPGGGTPEEFMREAIADRNLLNSKIDDLNKKMREVSGTPEYDKIMEQRMALTQEYLDKGYGDMASVYKNASDQYQRLAGEAQSRLAQTRIDLTPEERRKYFPFAYGKENYGLDVNPEELIFRQGGLLGQSKAALTPVFETGKEVTFPFIKNTEKAPKMSGFGQDIEPAGNYILSGHDVDRSKLASGWTTGEISFKNPLVIDWGKSGLYTEPDNWKQVLSSQYGGKTGKALSKAIAKDGYDGIVTMTEYGPSEIVDLSMFPKKKKSLLD